MTPQRTGSAISFMTKTSFLRSLIAVTAFLAAGQAALPSRRSASASRPNWPPWSAAATGGAPTGQMQAQRAEINRLVGYYRNIGCERGPLGFLAGPAPGRVRLHRPADPPARGRLCPPRARRTHDQGEIEARRRQLQAAVQQTCSTDSRAASSNRSSARRASQQPQQQIMPEGQPIIADDGPRSLGGGRLICVKTCDGSFFPLTTPPGGGQSANEMCQALCPGTETTRLRLSGRRQRPQPGGLAVQRTSPIRRWRTPSSSARASTRAAPARSPTRAGPWCCARPRACSSSARAT